ncbi:MAG: energy transducer TonB, partial [Paramuribaculum sp.]|nr:energy transducer TonB [Paramuribaculum sp.]
DDNKVFTSVEQMPVYPGGESALLAEVSKNIRYPSVAQENGIEGKVVVQFVVTKNGSIGEVKVVRGKDPDLDKEAKRVIKTLKKFTPGKMNGNAVNVWYTLPITFKLTK